MKECNQYDNWCEKEKRSCKNCYYEKGYNMSDEEKEAVEVLKVEIDNLKVSIAGFERAIEDKSCCNKVTGELKHEILIRETILNLIEKQSKEIEETLQEKFKNLKIEVDYVKIKMYSIKIGTKTIFYEWKDNLTFSANIENITYYIKIITGGKQ